MVDITNGLAYAIDFGTSNSLIAVCEPGGNYEILEIDPANSDPKIIRSLIFTPNDSEWYFGGKALDQYIEQVGEGRFFRSIKKFLPDEKFTGTTIHGRQYNISEIIAVFLREMKSRADQLVGADVKKVLLGRPASYSDNDREDHLAETRMRKAAELAGFEEVEFCPEPIAAAYGFGQEIDRTQLVFVADMGGGTSDFTIMKLAPGEFDREQVLGLGGIFVAGDAIDGSIMRHRICDFFGAKVKYSLPMGDRELRFPKWLLRKMCNPAHMAFLKERKIYEFLKEVQTFSLNNDDKRAMAWLFTLVEEQLGHAVFREIEKVKIELSENEKVLFDFCQREIKIREAIGRNEFRDYSQNQIDKIKYVLQSTIKKAQIDPKDMDVVCVTGGTGQVPMVQELLKECFGEEKLREHNHFKSVIDGLGRHASHVFWRK